VHGLGDRLARASPDLLRAMIKQFAGALMAAEADAACGASYRERCENRMNSHNGYRRHDWNSRAGSIELAIPKLRFRDLLPGVAARAAPRAEQALVSDTSGPSPR
jgi:putative transposase